MAVGTPYSVVAAPVTSTTNNNSIAITTNAVVNAGDTLFLFVSTRLSGQGTIPAVASSLAGATASEILVKQPASPSIGSSLIRVFCASSLASATTLTVTLSDTSSRKTMFAIAVPGLANANVDQTGSGNGSTGTITASTASAQSLGDAIAIATMSRGASAATDSGTPGAGYTELYDQTVGASSWGHGYAEYKILTIAATQTATFTPTDTTHAWAEIIGVWVGIGSTAWTISPTDSLTTSDAVDHFDYGMNVADSVTPSDAFSDVWTAALSLADALTSSDGLAFGVGKGAFADSLSLSDLATTGLAYNIFPADTLTSSDAIDHFDYGMKQADSLTPSDAFSRTWTALLSVADSMGTADAFGDSWAAVVGLVDSLSLSDLATPVLVSNPTAWTITLADVLTLFDAAAAINPLAPRIVRYDPNDYDPNFRPFR